MKKDEEVQVKGFADAHHQQNAALDSPLYHEIQRAEWCNQGTATLQDEGRMIATNAMDGSAVWVVLSWCVG